MRNSSLSILPLVSLLGWLALACSSDKPSSPAPGAPAPSGCSFTFSGNTVDSGSRDRCATLDVSGADDDGGVDAGDGGATTGKDQFLSLDFDSASITAFHAAITLGPTPTAGSFSSETLSAWDITLTNVTGCHFSAGSEVVPAGSFTLELSAPPALGVDAGAPSGRLDATLYLHAESGMDCGPGDTEQVAVRF